jgi:hypothetical protein
MKRRSVLFGDLNPKPLPTREAAAISSVAAVSASLADKYEWSYCSGVSTVDTKIEQHKWKTVSPVDDPLGFPKWGK